MKKEIEIQAKPLALWIGLAVAGLAWIVMLLVGSQSESSATREVSWVAMFFTVVGCFIFCAANLYQYYEQKRWNRHEN